MSVPFYSLKVPRTLTYVEPVRQSIYNMDESVDDTADETILLDLPNALINIITSHRSGGQTFQDQNSCRLTCKTMKAVRDNATVAMHFLDVDHDDEEQGSFGSRPQPASIPLLFMREIPCLRALDCTRASAKNFVPSGLDFFQGFPTQLKVGWNNNPIDLSP